MKVLCHSGFTNHRSKSQSPTQNHAHARIAASTNLERILIEQMYTYPSMASHKTSLHSTTPLNSHRSRTGNAGVKITLKQQYRVPNPETFVTVANTAMHSNRAIPPAKTNVPRRLVV